MAEKREVVEAVRDVVGDGVEVAFDCHWDYTVESAKRLAAELEPYDLLWLEAVVPPENVDAQIEVTGSTSTPIATGENRFRAFELSELIYEHGVDVVTPDSTTVGGLAETIRVADRAEENYVPMSPHNVCSPVGTIVCVHLAAATPNFDLLEYHRWRSTGGRTCSRATSRSSRTGRSRCRRRLAWASSSTNRSSRSTCSTGRPGSECGGAAGSALSLGSPTPAHRERHAVGVLVEPL